MACLARVVLDLVYRRLQVSAAPSPELDYRTGGRHVDAPYSCSYFLQGVRYYDEDTVRLMFAVSTNVSTRFAKSRNSVPFNQYAVYTSCSPDI